MKGGGKLMFRKVFLVMCILALMMLLGATTYASNGMMIKSERTIAPQPEQALLVLLRSTLAGCAISASVFDVTGEETKFIGIIRNGTKLIYDLTPGEHTLMVISESADFMKVTVEAGKTYYALVTPRMGAMKARFSFKPLRQTDLASSNFAKWDEKTELVENTSESEAWAVKNAPDINRKREKYWPAWTAKPLAEQEEQTLKVEDGR
jgi:hypothetical protein